MLFKDCNSVCIHYSGSEDRNKYIDEIYEYYPDSIIMSAIIGNDLPKEQKIFYKQLHKSKQNSFKLIHECKLYNTVGRLLSHLKSYKYIIDNKLNNCIIFEDDIKIHDKSFYEMEIPQDDDIIYLGHNLFYLHQLKHVIGTHAIYYKSWELVEELYDYIVNDFNEWQPFDLYLSKIILPKYKHSLYRFIKHCSKKECLSLIDN
jgi:hypothetical protein